MRLDPSHVFAGTDEGGFIPFSFSGDPENPTVTTLGNRRCWLIDEQIATAMLDPADSTPSQRARLASQIWRPSPAEVEKYNLPVWAESGEPPVLFRELPDTAQADLDFAFRKVRRPHPSPFQRLQP